MAKQTILIADDDKQLVDILKRRCEALGLQVITAHDALGAMNLVFRDAPDVVCLDVNMPCGNGLSVAEMMSNDERFSQTPVIMLTGESEPQMIRRCHDMCVYYVQKGGNIWDRVRPLITEFIGTTSPSPETPPENRVDPRDRVLDAIFGALGADENYFDLDDSGMAPASEATASNTSPWVLHVDDDREFREVVRLRLESRGISVAHAFDGSSGIRTAFTHPASAIILDYEMPNGQGDYVLNRLKDNAVTRDIPVIVLTGVQDKFLERRLLAMGASAFFNKPPKFDELIEALQHLLKAPSTAC